MDRREYHREYMRKKRGVNKDVNNTGEDVNTTDGNVNKVLTGVNKKLYLSDLGVDLKELGVQSCGPGLPIVLVDMPTIEQIQGLCKVIHAMNGNLEWEPRCGMGNSY